MEQKQINQLMIAMGRYGMKKLSLKKDGFEISLEREDVGRPFSHMEMDNPLRGDFERHLASSAHKVEQEKQSFSAPSAEDVSLFIPSPMVGTFYRAASPTDAPYAKPGDSVDEHTVVGIVEAMKVMNEVKAGVRGTVVEVLVENGQPVEFGAKLFRITPTK